MCVTDNHDMTLAVEVALNPNTTNNSLFIFVFFFSTRPILFFVYICICLFLICLCKVGVNLCQQEYISVRDPVCLCMSLYPYLCSLLLLYLSLSVIPFLCICLFLFLYLSLTGPVSICPFLPGYVSLFFSSFVIFMFRTFFLVCPRVFLCLPLFLSPLPPSSLYISNYYLCLCLFISSCLSDRRSGLVVRASAS